MGDSKNREQKRTWTEAPFHPLLFAAHPVLCLLSANPGEVRVADIWRPLAVALAGTGALLACLRLVSRNAQRAAIVVSLFLGLFFGYHHVASAIDRLTTFPATVIWGFLFLLILSGAVKLRYNDRRATQLFNLVGVGLALAALATIGASRVAGLRANRTHLESTRIADTEQPLRPKYTPSPDIYYIILDSYANADVLKEAYGEDISGFTDYLTKRGFYVVKESKSDYMWTMQSLASSLNMRKLETVVVPQLRRSAENQTVDIMPGYMLEQLRHLIRGNLVCRQLKLVGYNVIFFPSNYSCLDGFPADRRILKKYEISEYERNLIMLTPISVVGRILSQMCTERGIGFLSPYGAERTRTLEILDGLGRVPSEGRPVFVLAHIPCPHPPEVSGRRGSVPAKVVNRRTRYADDVAFLNKRLPEVIDRILAVSLTPPIIVLQGDHGPRGETTAPPSAPLPGRSEQFGALNAYYLPRGGDKALYPGITPVNTFRVIFNEYFGTHYGLVPDESYLSDLTPYHPGRHADQGAIRKRP